METARTFLSLLAKPRSVVLLTMLYLVFVLLIFPAAAIDSTAPPIDLAFHYSVDQVYEWIELYGEEGRKRYMIGELTVDMLYPLVYTFLFCGLLGLFTNISQAGKYSQLAYLPAGIWLFDMLENTGIVAMLYNYPEKLHAIAAVTSWFTTIKWSLAVIVIALTLVFGIRFAYQKLTSD